MRVRLRISSYAQAQPVAIHMSGPSRNTGCCDSEPVVHEAERLSMRKRRYSMASVKAGLERLMPLVSTGRASVICRAAKPSAVLAPPDVAGREHRRGTGFRRHRGRLYLSSLRASKPSANRTQTGRRSFARHVSRPIYA
jgi:hypothetical protein